ncbi:MAG: hypothetical protein EA370_06270 [Wenzhouxiangella sp.]|nr:MAG: hypothetical protein EA370_06270 [Wenzhouxiangella sp.]
MIKRESTNFQAWAASIVVIGLWLMPLKGHAEDEFIDFADQLVPVCNVLGLLATPPADWFAVPMEGLPEQLAGCQMMRTGPTEELVGIIRVSGSRVRDGTPGTDSRQRHTLFEIEVLRNMGIVLDLEEPLWSRDSVPLADFGAAGFSDVAQAIGYRAVIVDTRTPQEVHLLTFHGPSTQYALVLITAPRFMEAEIYQRNTTDFGRVLGTLDAAR